MADQVRAVVRVTGRVQGVGFRYWTRRAARELDLVGHAQNLPDGSVEVDVQGSRSNIEALQRLLGKERSLSSRPGRIDNVQLTWHDPLPDRSDFLAR